MRGTDLTSVPLLLTSVFKPVYIKRRIEKKENLIYDHQNRTDYNTKLNMESINENN
jgi:hypothetical protein